MFNSPNVQQIQSCLDAYMMRVGKIEISDSEANHELERAGVMIDDLVYPGEPLRAFLRKLRDSNLLPKNIRQQNSVWAIKHSKLNAKMQMIFKQYL